MKKILLLAALFLLAGGGKIFAQSGMVIANGSSCDLWVTLYAYNGSGCSDLVSQTFHVPAYPGPGNDLIIGVPTDLNGSSCSIVGAGTYFWSPTSSCAIPASYWTYAVVQDPSFTYPSVTIGGIPACASSTSGSGMTGSGCTYGAQWTTSWLGLEVEID